MKLKLTILISLFYLQVQVLATDNIITLDTPINYGLEAIKNNQIKIQNLFYEKHANSNYNPIKLEASMSEPIAIDLATLLAESIENNLNLNIARADSTIAKWRLLNKLSDALPDVAMTTSSQHREGTFYLNSKFDTTIDETIVSAGLRVSYRAFNGGTTSFLAWAEKYYKQSTELKESAQYNKTLLDGLTNYFDILERNAAINSALKSLESAQANYDVALKFFNAGNGTKYDTLQAESRLAKAQKLLIEQELNFRVSQINLAALLNRPLLTPFIISENTGIKKLALIDETLTMESFIERAFKTNPEILSAIKLKSGAQKEGLAKIGDFLPKMDIYTAFNGTGGAYNDLFGITTLGFDINYDIGQGLGGNALAGLMEARTKVRKAELEYQQKLQNIEKSLRLAFLDYEKSKSLVEAAYKGFQASEEALRLAKLRYENGIEIFANLVEKEKELSEAELNLISSTTEYNRSQAKLAYQMGDISIEKILKQ